MPTPDFSDLWSAFAACEWVSAWIDLRDPRNRIRRPVVLAVRVPATP
jgi:hypothetical protein